MPRHIALIMDGNGRWAERNRLPRAEGHRRGARIVGDVVNQCRNLGIRQVTLYCLSHENWKRPESELEFLMQLCQQFMIEARADLLKHEIRMQVIGRRGQLPEAVQREIDKTIEMTRHFDRFCMCLAINYGARQEIVDACRRIAQQAVAGELDPPAINEAVVEQNLYTAGMPDPDLLIRTAGEMRVSNYLLWQISYAELWVTERCWPEFRIEDLHQAIREFATRQRRFGGLVQPEEPAGP